MFCAWSRYWPPSTCPSAWTICSSTTCWSLIAGNGYRWYAQEDIDLVHEYVDLDFIVEDYDPRGVLTSFRAPAYPAFLAGVYSVSGLEWRLIAARLAQAALGAALAPLGYLLARRFFPKEEDAARFAGYALAFYPILILYPLALATENLFIPLALTGLLATMHAAQSGKGRDFFLAGALFGAAALTRSVVFAFVCLTPLWIWFAARQKRGALLFTLAVLVFVVPWSVRNSLLHGRLTFIENSLGFQLFMGYHPEGSGTFQYGISLVLVPYLDDRIRNEVGVRAGLEFIRQDPGRVPYLVVRKAGYFFGLVGRGLNYLYSNNYFGYISLLPLLALFLVFNLPFPILSTVAFFGLPFIQWSKEEG